METSAWNSYIVMANWLHQAILCRWLPWNCETSAAEMEWLRLNWLFFMGSCFISQSAAGSLEWFDTHTSLQPCTGSRDLGKDRILEKLTSHHPKNIATADGKGPFGG